MNGFQIILRRFETQYDGPLKAAQDAHVFERNRIALETKVLSYLSTLQGATTLPFHETRFTTESSSHGCLVEGLGEGEEVRRQRRDKAGA